MREDITIPELRQAIRETLLGSGKRRFRFLMLSWLTLFVIAMVANLWTPRGWPPVVVAIARLPINFLISPLACWTGYYFLAGPRHARRYRLILQFIAANFLRPTAIVGRAGRVKS